MKENIGLLADVAAFVSVPVLILMAELFLITVLVRLMNRLAMRRLGRLLYLLTMWPGVVVHELSHAAACLLTLTRITEVKLFAPQRTVDGGYVLGYVEHAVPRSRFARLLIGVAPFFGGTLTLLITLNLIFPEGFRSFWRLAVDSGIADWPAFRSALMAWSGGAVVGLATFGVWQWLGVYLMVSVAAHTSPSSVDLRGSVWPLLAVVFGVTAIMGLISLVSPAAAWSVAGFGRAFFTAVAAVMAAGLALVALALAITAVMTAPLELLGRLRQRR
jgi:hypothetical protein